MRDLARPTRLSDPGGDFGEEELRSILATPDQQMGFDEFNCLFQGRLPAGTYGEVIYFFPMMMNYLLEARDGWETLFTNVMVWLNANETQLRKDGRWEAIYEETYPVLAGTEALLLKRFEAITSYDAAAWFVYLTKHCPHLTCLKPLGAEGDRLARAEALIMEETLRNPLHLRFWDRELATYY